jgi:hypothetical protein
MLMDEESLDTKTLRILGEKYDPIFNNLFSELMLADMRAAKKICKKIDYHLDHMRSEGYGPNVVHFYENVYEALLSIDPVE